jgi:hypothetical protein
MLAKSYYTTVSNTYLKSKRKFYWRGWVIIKVNPKQTKALLQ